VTGRATEEQNAAYRVGLCIGLCGKPYAAGMTRCYACHTVYQQPPTKETI
jgi:hypothetical protein